MIGSLSEFMAMPCLVVYGIIRFLSHLSRLFGYVYGTFGSSQYCWVTLNLSISSSAIAIANVLNYYVVGILF